MIFFDLIANGKERKKKTQRKQMKNYIQNKQLNSMSVYLRYVFNTAIRQSTHVELVNNRDCEYFKHNMKNETNMCIDCASNLQFPQLFDGFDIIKTDSYILISQCLNKKSFCNPHY